MCVRQASGEVKLRGLLVVFPGYSRADCCKMLLTELQLCPTEGDVHLSAVSEDGAEVLCNLSGVPPHCELLPRLPTGPCSLLIGNCPPPPWTIGDAS